MSILIPKYKTFQQELQIGEYTIYLPDPPDLRKIEGHDLPKEKQMWRPPQYPNGYHSMPKSMRSAWENAQLDKCYETGHWLWINGQIHYMTPKHYHYCSFWKIDIGLPHFRWTNAKFYYLWDDVEKDDACIGLVEITNRRDGKCFAAGTKIRMYDGGVKNVEDIREGELVMGPDSQPRITSGITSGTEEMFEIIPNKGDSFSCNASHILSLVYNGRPSVLLGWTSGQVVNISVKEYLSLPDWARQFLVLYRSGWGNNWPEQNNKIPAYILGVWLGDGVSKNGKFACADPEILKAITEYGQLLGMDMISDKNDKYCYGLSRKNSGSRIKVYTETGPLEFDSIKAAAIALDGAYNPKRKKLKEQFFYKKYRCEIVDPQQKNEFRSLLNELDLLNNKHIPEIYLRDSRKNRLELLAGLIDTDGHLMKTKSGHPRQIEITQKNKVLSYQIVELARSLGFYVHVAEKTATMRREDASMYSCPVYRINIFGNLYEIPCRVHRKKSKKVDRRVDSSRTGFKIRSKGLGKYYGFTVDQDSLFLLSDGMVVHNTYRGGQILFHRSSETPNTIGGIQSKTDRDAAKVFRKAVVNPFKKLPKFLQPAWDGNTNPKSELNFYAPSRRMQNTDNFEIEDALETTIDFRPVSEESYDGEYLVAYFRDEFGKCLAKGTPVLMYDGTIKLVEDIVAGDIIMGPDSRPRTVLSLARGQETMYRVIPNKGIEWGCNESHILSLKVASKDRFLNKGLRKGDVLNITVKDYLQLSKSDQKHLVLYRVGVDYENKPVHIDPYIMGAWLGDGNSLNAQFTTTDPEILEAFTEYALTNDLVVKPLPDDKISYRLTNEKDSWSLNKMRQALTHYNLFGNKHIPKDYIINDRNTRLELLAGIIDTDGHLQRNSKSGFPATYEVTQKRKELAEAITVVANSLGLYATINEKTATMKREDGSVYRCQVHRVNIYGDLHIIPCRVPHKKAEKCDYSINRRNALHTGFKLQNIGVGDYYGFTITGDRLFLLGDYTVTHNTIKADIYEGHEMTKFCFYKGSTVVGKALYSTTVEEMEKKGGKPAKKLWDDSNPTDAKNDALGQTKSNLRRYFKPAYEGLEGVHPITKKPFIDIYGFDIIGEDGEPVAKKYLEQRRERIAKKKDWNGLASEKRKYPFSIEEAFRTDSKDCHFNAEKIQARLSYLNEHHKEKPLYMRGNFHWKNNEPDTEVIWVPNEHEGRFLVWKLPDQEDRNKFEITPWGKKKPLNFLKFAAGADPYDHKKVENKAKASNAAAYVFRKFDANIDTPDTPLNEQITYAPWVEYVERPPKPEDFYEDMIKVCHFYGCRMYPETNRPGLRNWFENRGYYNYLQGRPDWTFQNSKTKHENTPGMASVDYTIQQYVDAEESFVEDHTHKVVFPRLLQSLLDFEIDNRTKYDEAVAFGFTLIGAMATNKKVKPEQGKVPDNEIKELLEASYAVSVPN